MFYLIAVTGAFKYISTSEETLPKIKWQLYIFTYKDPFVDNFKCNIE